MNLKADIDALNPSLVAVRRDLHQHPEIAFEEHRTAGVIEAHLRDLGLEPRRVAGTGVTADIKGGKPGRTVMIRADIDALPITETTGAAYASLTPGRMHACGHDGHTSVALHAATILARHAADLPGTYRLVFQPAEETVGGATRVIAENVMDGVDRVIGLHLWNSLPAGTIAVSAGPIMAAPDAFTITIHGSGGHAAIPHETIDPVVAAAHVITALQTIVSRETDPQKASVVTIATVIAGEGAHNIIPSTAELRGTLRTFDAALRERLRDRIAFLVTHTALGLGARASIEFHHGPPPVTNDAELTEQFKRVARDVAGPDRVTPAVPVMGGDDMAEYLVMRPGVYFWVGSSDPATGKDRPHHHPGFDIDDERALPVALEALTLGAIDLARP